MAYRIRPLDSVVDTTGFRCGRASLDEYIRRYASQDVRRGIARVFVATPAEDSVRLAGFFCLSAGAVNAANLPPALARRLPRYPVPVALLGRMAVDQSFQRQGLGSILLSEACQKVLQASQVLAVAAIVVDAKDAAAAAFYGHFGFLPLPGRAERLFLPYRLREQLTLSPPNP